MAYDAVLQFGIMISVNLKSNMLSDVESSVLFIDTNLITSLAYNFSVFYKLKVLL